MQVVLQIGNIIHRDYYQSSATALWTIIIHGEEGIINQSIKLQTY